MSATSPPPESSPSAVPPTSSNTPSPQSLSPPASPSSQPNANPPVTTPSTSAPPPQSPPPAVPAAPPPSTMSSPPPDSPVTSSPPPPSVTSNPPPAQAVAPSPPPPSNDPPPPPTNSTSPPPSAKPPLSSPSPPPPSSTPPISSPPPPTSTPPEASPPPPTTKPPANSPPPPTSKPPANSPPPPSSEPPTNSPPPPSSDPPQKSPPPPASKPPQSSPPPPAINPPENSPPPPASDPPSNSPPPPKLTPPSPTSQPAPPPPNSTSKSSPPPPIIRLSPPPPSSVVSPPSSSLSPPSPTQTSVSPTGSNNGISTGVVVAISSIVGLLVISLIGLLVWCIMKRKRKASGLNGGYIMPSPFGSSPNSDSSFRKAHSSAPLIGSGSGSDSVSSPTELGGLGNSRPWFTYEELVVATNGFSAENLLGEGGFGSVYKGCLPDGREIAVKQLKIGGGQGEREFKAEVEIISRIHHRHLVSLVGYCIADARRLLIYEYVPNDTLYFHLHGAGQPVMDWARRFKVAAGAARGIAYLHEDCHPRVIHRDIKSSNILLDTNFEARVSDFGLAKLAIDADTHITTRVMGTFGYMAPEYASSGKLTEKSDVYSFGVVLLELITGRKPVDTSQPLGDESLVEWARPLLSDAIDREQFDSLVDPRLEKNYVESEMFRMIEAAAACVRHSAAKRPRMGQVVRALDSVAASDLTNGMRPGESEVFNSAQQSAEIRLFRRMAFGSQNYSTDFFSQSSLNT